MSEEADAIAKGVFQAIVSMSAGAVVDLKQVMTDEVLAALRKILVEKGLTVLYALTFTVKDPKAVPVILLSAVMHGRYR